MRMVRTKKQDNPPVLNRQLIADLIEYIKSDSSKLRMESFWSLKVSDKQARLPRRVGDLRTCTTTACLFGTAMLLNSGKYEDFYSFIDGDKLPIAFPRSPRRDDDSPESEMEIDFNPEWLDDNGFIHIDLSSDSEITIGARLFGITARQAQGLFFKCHWPASLSELDDWPASLSNMVDWPASDAAGAVLLLQKILIDGPEILDRW